MPLAWISAGTARLVERQKTLRDPVCPLGKLPAVQALGAVAGVNYSGVRGAVCPRTLPGERGQTPSSASPGDRGRSACQRSCTLLVEQLQDWTVHRIRWRRGRSASSAPATPDGAFWGWAGRSCASLAEGRQRLSRAWRGKAADVVSAWVSAVLGSP